MSHKFHLYALATAIAATTAWLAWPRVEEPEAVARPSRPWSEAPEHQTDDASLAPRTGTSAAPPAFVVRATADEWRGEATREALSAALCQFAEGNPSQAVALLDRIPDDVRPVIQQEVAAALIAGHPLESVKLLDALPPSETTDQMLRQAAMEYTERHADDALAWALDQPDPETRALLLSGVLCARATTDPAAAASAALRELPSGPQRDRLTAEIILRWEQVDAAAAAAFRQSLPLPAAETAALSGSDVIPTTDAGVK